MGTLSVITAPVAEPVTLQEAKDILRVDGNDEDGRIQAMIQVAREWVEQYTGLYLMTTVLELSAEEWGGTTIPLMVWPLQSIDSVKYDDTDSPVTTQTLVENTDYYADTTTMGGRIIAISGWPSVASQPNAIRVRMTAGYASAQDVPEIIKMGLKAYIVYLYDADEDMLRSAQSILSTSRYIK